MARNVQNSFRRLALGNRLLIVSLSAKLQGWVGKQWITLAKLPSTPRRHTTTCTTRHTRNQTEPCLYDQGESYGITSHSETRQTGSTTAPNASVIILRPTQGGIRPLSQDLGDPACMY
jgi:hypothetical protein